MIANHPAKAVKENVNNSNYLYSRSRSGRAFEGCKVNRILASFDQRFERTNPKFVENFTKLPVGCDDQNQTDYELYDWKYHSDQPLVVKEVGSGKEYISLLTMDGRLFFMGANTFSFCAAEDGSQLPENIPYLKEVCAKIINKKNTLHDENGIELHELVCSNFLHVGSGMYFIVALTSDYRLISSGSNECGQRGVGQNQSRNTFAECIFKEDLQICKNEILRGIVKIACGYQHSMILTRDGTIIGTGCSYQRQLGTIENEISYEYTKLRTPPTSSTIVDVQCGHFCSSCMDADGMVYVIGQESYTRLIPADNWTKLQTFVNNPVQYMIMSCSNSFFKTISGAVYHNWGINDDVEKKEHCTLIELSEISNVEYIFGKENFFMVTESNNLYLSSNTSSSGMLKPPPQETQWFEYNALKPYTSKNGRYQTLIIDAFNISLYLILSSSKEGHLKDNLKILLQRGQTDFEKNYFMDIIIK